MNIKLTINKTSSFFAITVLLALCSVSADSLTESPLIFTIEKKETICIAATGKSKNKCDTVIATKSVDSATKKILDRSDEVVPIFSQPTQSGYNLVFIARLPSKSPQSSGYCGAGYEDHLVLLAYKEKKLNFQDDFLLQSCLKSIDLASDGGDDILKAIAIDLDKHRIGFKWLTDPDDKAHTISILNGKFLLN